MDKHSNQKAEIVRLNFFKNAPIILPQETHLRFKDILNNLGIDGNFFNLIKSSYKTSHLITHLIVKDWVLSP